MRKPFVVLLTLLITGLCLFELSFTFRARQIDDEARSYAMTEEGVVNWEKLQEYRDSIWNEPVYLGYSYKEITERRINLGLDLQGGMHVTLEVSPIDILRALIGDNPPPSFEQAIAKASEEQKNSQDSFTKLFFDAFDEVAPDTQLAELFATASNKGRIDFNSTNEEVKDAIEKEVADAINRAEQIIKTRIDKFGVSQPNVQRIQGTGRIQIELPGVDNPTRVRKLLQGVAKLEFLEVYTAQEYDPILGRLNEVLLNKEKAEKALAEGDNATQTTEEATGDDLIVDEDGEELTLIEGDSSNVDSDSTAIQPEAQMSSLFQMLRGFQPVTFETSDTSAVNDILSRPDIKALFPATLRLVWDVKPFVGEDGTEYVALYFLKTRRGGKAPLSGEVVIDASQTYDQLGNPDVSMQMNVQGAKQWRKLTRANKGRQVAIVLDNYVYSAPNVREEIAGGRSSISGGFSLEEAQDLANILKAGKLPAPTRIVEEAVVGPTLGLKAQTSGLVSILAGLAIVVLFMIAYYSKGGLVANLALLFNIFFIVGILAQLHAALTLPGIAGIVLTIGMSIDANVLIFERIREELRLKPGNLMAAIDTGYDKAFWTIFDANVTTALTGVFLYAFGSGPVKGFAVTLLIGIGCSFFSAVFITREVVAWMTKKGNDSKLSFATPFSKNLLGELKYKFLNKRRMAYIFSAAVIVIGWGMIAVQGGLNLGVDFLGGRSYQVNFTKEVSASEVKVALADDVENKGLEVKTFGDDQTLKITTNYKVDDESDQADQDVRQALISGLEEFTGDKFVDADKEPDPGTFTIPYTAKVGATIADDIADSARTAVLFSLIAIFFYIWIRFRRWRFGLGAVSALFHDTLMVFAIFGIARAFGISYEIDQVFVAAMLTIIGYSINDTVVVFDRIREYLAESKGETFEETLDHSINSTLNRTLITSVTTLLVVLILFLFGGEVLRGFSFALLVGVLFGTYSSIFIATPIVFDSTRIGGGSGAELAASKPQEKPAKDEEA